MKTLVCSKCGRTQAKGRFCLDCGGAIIEKVTIGVKFNQIRTKRGSETLKKDIRNWLARLGVDNKDIQIETDVRSGHAVVNYKLLGQHYSVKSIRQPTATDNLAAIELLVHNRVIGIERGVESHDQAFAGYAALPAPEDIKPAPTGYDAMSELELKKLLAMYHPDTGGTTKDTQKFMAVKAALDRKR